VFELLKNIMKVPPLSLPPNMNRVGMALQFSPEFLWPGYPMGFPQTPKPELKSQIDLKSLPSHISLDPHTWSREDVLVFLRWVEAEYDVPAIDTSKFCMNGKALLMLNKTDMTDRSPEAGDIVHNTLHTLLDAHSHVPPSPSTPLFSPPGQWPLIASHDLHSLSHILQQNNSSVTLSPAHSEQSGGSPRHPDHSSAPSAPSNPAYSPSEDSEDSAKGDISPQRSPPPQSLSAQQAMFQKMSEYQRTLAAAAAAAAAAKHDGAQQKYQLQQMLQMQQQQQPQQQQGRQWAASQDPPSHPPTSSHAPPIKFSPPAPAQTPYAPPAPQEEPVEPGTNGRLLWDFLQQLLNDKEQKYARFIAWRNAETGVFKIVDPAGLAKLWGIQKNHLSMNYDKMSRALRYYYRVNILRKVQGERHCYQFLRNPSELRSIKNISSLKISPVVSRSSNNQSSDSTESTVKREGASHKFQLQQVLQMQQQQQQQASQQMQQQMHHQQDIQMHQQQHSPPPLTHAIQHQRQPQQEIPTQQTQLSPSHYAQEDEGPTDLSMASNHGMMASSHGLMASNHGLDMRQSSPYGYRHSASPQDMSMDVGYGVKTEDEDVSISVDYEG